MPLQPVIMRYNNALQHVTKGYNRFKALVTNYKVTQILQNSFPEKWVSCHNKLQCVICY